MTEQICVFSKAYQHVLSFLRLNIDKVEIFSVKELTVYLLNLRNEKFSAEGGLSTLITLIFVLEEKNADKNINLVPSFTLKVVFDWILNIKTYIKRNTIRITTITIE